MFLMFGNAAFQSAKTVGAFTTSDKYPTLFHRVVDCCSDMFIRMFLHQRVPVSMKTVLTFVNMIVMKNNHGKVMTELF
ncbi:hypothetical protein MXL54_08805 [Enterobacteriaceae bacterium G50]|nr:hypothetical protein [Enterobacteriaceae bacterium G50]